MITKREIKVIEFVNKFGIVSTSFLHEVVYKPSSLRYCQDRLQMLSEEYGELKRDRQSIHSQYVYYKTKPKQLLHRLLLSELYKNLHKIGTIKIFELEYSLENIRADALAGYEIKGELDFALVEIDISQNSIKAKINKYENFDKSQAWKEKNWPRMAKIIIVGNRKLPKSHLDIVQIDTEFSNIERLLK